MAQIEDQVTDAGSEGYAGSERIRADIDRTRANMDETINAIDSKLTPSQLLLEAWGLLKGGSGAGASRIMRMAREHPLPSLVIGAGVSWMLLESSRGDGGARRRTSRYDNRRFDSDDAGSGSYGYGESRYAADRDWDERSRYGGGKLASAGRAIKDAASGTREAASSAVDKVGDLAGHAGEKVGELADQAGEKLGQAAGAVRETASELGERTRHQARRAKRGFWNLLEERPLSVGAVTLALGVLAGLSIPSTEREDELMGETRDRLLDQAKETGREVLDKGKQVAHTTVETLKDEAERQDLTPGGLAEKVRTVVKEAVDATREEAKSQGLTPPKPSPVEEPELAGKR
jgi:hypothetical protein